MHYARFLAISVATALGEAALLLTLSEGALESNSILLDGLALHLGLNVVLIFVSIAAAVYVFGNTSFPRNILLSMLTSFALAVSLWVIWRAFSQAISVYHRLIDPPKVDGRIMLAYSRSTLLATFILLLLFTTSNADLGIPLLRRETVTEEYTDPILKRCKERLDYT